VRAPASKKSGRPCRDASQVTLTSRWLRFACELASGAWSIDSVAETPSLHLAAAGRIELLAPDGQVLQRDVSDATLLEIDTTELVESRSGERLQVRRAWHDGLVAVQTFELARDSAVLTASLSIETTRPVGLALRAIEPIARPDRSAANLAVAPALEYALDFGWSAAVPPRRVKLGDASEIVTTGLVTLGSSSLDRALALAFANGRDIVGEYRFQRRNDPASSVVACARAWVGDVDLAPLTRASAVLWLCVDRLDEALLRFAAQQRPTGPQVDRVDQQVELPPGGTMDRHCPVWFGLGALTKSGQGPAVQGSSPPLDERAVLDRLAGAVASGYAPALNVALLPADWRRADGDWRADPDRYSRGLRALAEVVHDARLHAGVEVAPFGTHRTSDLVRDHPTWLLRAPNGDPVPVESASGDFFALDPTNPEVREWLRALGRQLAEWGFDAVRVDCSASVLSPGWQQNGTLSPLAAFRAGLAALRSGLAGRPIAVSGGPLFATLDRAEVVETDSRPLSRADPASLLRAFLGQGGPLASAGPLRVNMPEQTLDEARAAATIACFAGGALLLDESAVPMPRERSRLVEVCLPPLRATFLPVDPFATAGPRLFRATIRQRWEEWQLVVALNPSSEPAAIAVPFASLGIRGQHHAFEFWRQQYLGAFADNVALDSVSAGGCQVIALRPVQRLPQVVGTSLHVGLGAVDVQDVRWRDDSADLSLSLTAVGDREGAVTIALPAGWTPGSVRGSGGHFAISPLAPGLLRLDCRFRDLAEPQITFWPESP
jgi:hypothetical protein